MLQPGRVRRHFSPSLRPQERDDAEHQVRRAVHEQPGLSSAQPPEPNIHKVEFGQPAHNRNRV